MSKKFSMLMLFVCILFLSSCGSSDSPSATTPVAEPWNSYDEAEKAAKAQLVIIKDEFKDGGYQHYNFSSLEELNRAAVGKGYRVYNLYFDDMKAYSSNQSVRSMITTTYYKSASDKGQWEFPILVDNSIKTTLSVFYIRFPNQAEGSWWANPLVNGKSSSFVKDVEAKLPAFLRANDTIGYKTFFVPIPALATEMMLVTTDAGEFIALSSSAQVFGLENKDFYTPEEIMPALQKAIENIIPDVLDNSIDKTHSSGYCSYENAEKTAKEQRLSNLTFFFQNDGYHFKAIFGDSAIPDQISLGEGYRLVDINFKGYQPQKTVKSLLYSNDCIWKFALYLDNVIKSDFTSMYGYEGYEFETLYSWGGTGPYYLKGIVSEIPKLLADKGASVYNLYWIKNPPPQFNFVLIETDKGEFISFGVPPFDPAYVMFTPEGTVKDERTFYSPEEVMPKLKAWYDYVTSPNAPVL